MLTSLPRLLYCTPTRTDVVFQCREIDPSSDRGSPLQMAILYVVHIFGTGYRQFLGPNSIWIDKSINIVNDKEAISYIQYI